MTEDNPRFGRVLDEAARKAFSEAYQRAIDSGAEVAVREGNEIIVLQKIDGEVRQVRSLGPVHAPTHEQLDLFDRLRNRHSLRRGKTS